ncbi:MAG TPA: serine/threonine-protein kinase, partial [Gemmataceae bacterium]|nr:serine/threonine-protein kinase [Gemmataceae bacterium]
MLTLTPTIGEAGWDECESVIRQFEDAWRDSGRPEIGDFVSSQSPHSARLLLELAHIDLEFRLRTGEDARTEDYLDRFPQLGDEALDLLEAEFALRNRHRPPAYPEEFWLRFPEHMTELRDRLADTPAQLEATRPAQPAGPQLPATPAIPGYEFLGELGRGGMGVVYKARDTLLNRVVAVKTFSAVPRPDACARFARESEAIARLDHAHIVPVYTVGEWGESRVPYFAMKWYPGGNLDSTPSGAGTPVADHARTVETIARAVHHAHQRGILHRDLKPSNILLDDEGRPHVADFGLAGRLEEDGSGTRTGLVVGTPAYMAPEQARTPKEVSTAADVYGLGAVLYHQLTGRPPFAGDTPLATLDMVVNDDPVPPSALNPAVPRDLETIALKCLEKDPARRYASADALADDLSRWQNGLSIMARPAHPWTSAWRRVRRHPVVTALALTTFFALVGSIVVLAVSYTRIRAKEIETADALARESAARKNLQASHDREQNSLYVERVSSAGRLYHLNQLPQAWVLLDQCPEHLRGWEWRYLDSRRRAEATRLEGHRAWVGGLKYLPDGRLASGDGRGEVRVWGADGQVARTFSAGDGAVITLATHPTRNWVAVTATRGAFVWDADTGAEVRKLRGGSYFVAFDPTGRYALVAGDKVRLFTLPDWESAGEFEGHTDRLQAVAFAPDGRRFVTSAWDNTIRSWDIEKQAQVSSRPVPATVMALAFTSDGKLLAEGHRGAVVFTDPVSGEVRDRVARPANEWVHLATGPDPDTVALCGAQHEVILWDVPRRRATRTFRGHTAHVAALAFGPGGKLASSGTDRVIRVWDTAREPDARTLAAVGGGGTLSLSPDGELVAVGQRANGNPTRGAAVVFDARTGGEVQRFPAEGEVHFHPTTGHLFTARAGVVRRRDPRTGQDTWPVSPEAAVGRVSPRLAVSPDGARVATLTTSGDAVQVWDAADGRSLGTASAGGFVTGLAFSPDSKKLAAVTADAITVWDAATLKVWESGAAGAFTLAYHPSGDTLATVDQDRIIRLRDAHSG